MAPERSGRTGGRGTGARRFRDVGSGLDRDTGAVPHRDDEGMLLTAFAGINRVARPSHTFRRVPVHPRTSSRNVGSGVGRKPPPLKRPSESTAYRIYWRREWDSNPRYAFTHTRFPSVRLKPLGHPSARGGCGYTRGRVVRKGRFARGAPQASIFNAARKALCGISTLPNCRIRFLPSFCLSRSFRLRLMSPP